MRTLPIRLFAIGCYSLLAACDPFNTGFADVEEGIFYEAEKVSPVTVAASPLVVMTWNIKFGGGRLAFFWECNGTRFLMRAEETLTHLDGIARKIRQVDPDILLLQEIDVESSRSAYVDQVQYLLDHTGLNYGVYASAWRADLIPSDGLGRMDSGNAILSRWPIDGAQRIALPLISDQSFIERYFYLKRNILVAGITLAQGTIIQVLNIHAAAFATDDTKKKHIERFKEELDKLASQGSLFVAGGDLNAIPRGSPKRTDFPDDDCGDGRFEGDDYTGEDAWLDGLYQSYQPAVDLPRYQANPGDFYTFTYDEHGFWNRKLDYLFTNGTFRANAGVVHQDERTGSNTLPLSDHAPLVVLWEVL